MTKRNLLVAYVVLLHAVLGVVLLKSDFIDRLRIAFGAAPPEHTYFYHAMLPYHKRQDGSIPDNATLFIGDSIVQGLATAAVAARSVNLGIGTDTTAGLLSRLPLYQSMQSVGRVVLSIGVNDLQFRNNNEIVANYRALLNQMPDNAAVYVNSVFPVDEQYGFAAGTNRRIAALNGALAKLVESFPNASYIDVHGQFSNQLGALRAELHIGDGLHLNTAGNLLWAAALREQLGR